MSCSTVTETLLSIPAFCLNAASLMYVAHCSNIICMKAFMLCTSMCSMPLNHLSLVEGAT